MNNSDTNKLDTKKPSFYIFVGVIAFCFLLIIFLATGMWRLFTPTEKEEIIRTRIIIPGDTNSFYVTDQDGSFFWAENLNTKMPLEENEIVIAVLNKDSDDRLTEDQFVVYRMADETIQMFITLLSYDQTTRTYRRVWDMPIAATRPETISLFSQDLIGDRDNCVIITGMNAQNEHTMTVLRRNRGGQETAAFPVYRKIAELQVAGSISVQEVQRTIAYQQGIASGRSHNIVSYGPDPRSSNILDQLEILYSFNPVSQVFEQTNVTRIPGSQIEQRRTREILSGVPGVFEGFIEGLWYFINRDGTIDIERYIYFDPKRREIIFFGDESQQVFLWQLSRPTRFGIYVRTQNISITTLMRFVDIEMETMDRIRVRVTEDIRLRIAVSTTWDGSYRRARSAPQPRQIPQITPSVNTIYDTSWGRIQFNSNGEYAINSGGNIQSGRYVFFNVYGTDLLELRPAETGANRMVFRIENAAGVRILFPIRLGTTGFQDLLEPPVTFTPIHN